MQRILIRTFLYHFTACYIPGLSNELADCLSQLEGQKDTIKLPKFHLYHIKKQLSARSDSDSLNQLRLATQEDDELVLLKQTITQGWSSTIKEVPNVIQPYRTFHEEVTVEYGLVLKGTRTVILSKKHEAVLKLIHEGHLGLSKCKLHTKDTVYWPDLNDQLEKLVLNCELCLKYSQSTSSNLLYPWVRKYPYMHGQSLQQTFFTLREHPTYLLWITPADFWLCTSFH